MKNEGVLKIHQVLFSILLIGYPLGQLLLDISFTLSLIWLILIVVLIGIRLYLKPPINMRKGNLLIFILAIIGMIYITFF